MPPPQFELAIFLLTAACTVFPSIIPRMRPVALTFLASAMVLVMDNINAIFFLLRSDLAKTVYTARAIEVAQAGLLMVGIGNFLTVVCLGAYHPAAPHVDMEVHIPTKGAQNNV